MMDAVQKIAGFPRNDNQRLQAVLPVRPGGLGINSAEVLSPVTRFVSAWNFSCTGPDLTGYPEAQADEEPPMEDLATICKMLPGKCILPRVWLVEGRSQRRRITAGSHRNGGARGFRSNSVKPWPQSRPGGTSFAYSASIMLRLACGLTPSPQRLWVWKSHRLSSRFSRSFAWVSRVWFDKTPCPFCSQCCDRFGDHVLTCKKVGF